MHHAFFLKKNFVPSKPIIALGRKKKKRDIIKTHWESGAINVSVPPLHSMFMISNIFL